MKRSCVIGGKTPIRKRRVWLLLPCFMKKVETTTGEEFDYTNPKISMNQNGEKTHQIIRLAEVYCWYAEAVGRSKNR